MKKNLKKLTALLATATLATGVLAGCGSSDATKSSQASEPKTSEVSVSAEATSSAVEPEEFSYPMDGRKLTHAVSYLGQQEAAGYDNFGESEYAKAVSEATGIEVEYIQGKDDWFSLMIAEGEYPDVMELWWNSKYPGGLEGAAADGVIISLNEVIDQYMPNFKAWLENNPKDAEALYTADGIIYGIPFVYENSEMLNSTGLFIRKDWLDELNLDMPETIEDWYHVLTTFKEEKNVIPFSNVGTYVLASGEFRFAYAPYGQYSIDVESGDIVHTQSTDAYREYLTEMHKWYEEGLIDPDVSALDFTTVRAKVGNSEVGASWGWNEDLANMPEGMVAAPIPMKEEGAEIVHSGRVERTDKYWAAISTQCEDIEAAARYLDWFFTEEGIMTANFGIEGVSYTNDNGTLAYTDEMLNNPDGLSVSGAQGKYIRSYSAFPGIRAYDWAMLVAAEERVRDTYEIWGSVGTTDYRLPAAVKLSSEDASTVSEIEAEVKTYVKEMCMKFILGTEDIETKWDEYVETLKQFGLEEAVALYQAAYEDYLAR